MKLNGLLNSLRFARLNSKLNRARLETSPSGEESIPESDILVGKEKTGFINTVSLKSYIMFF